MRIQTWANGDPVIKKADQNVEEWEIIIVIQEDSISTLNHMSFITMEHE